MLSVSPLSRFTGFPGYVWVAFRVFFDVCIQFVFFSTFGCSILCFAAFFDAPGEVTGVPFCSFGALFRQWLAPSILNYGAVFEYYSRGSGDLKNMENQIKRY